MKVSVTRALQGSLIATTVCAGAVMADEAAEQLVADALPLMHHSCESVVIEADGNNDYIEEVVGAMVAVSLYNHEIDIADYASSEAEKTALRERFVEELAKECGADEDALLAGVVDDAVVYALSIEEDP